MLADQLASYDAAPTASTPTSSTSSAKHPATPPLVTAARPQAQTMAQSHTDTPLPMNESNTGTALSGADSLSSSFRAGFNGEEDEDDNDDEDDDEEVDGVDHPISVNTPHAQRVLEAKKWADDVIFNTRRKSARQTEESVIRIWKRWLPQAIASGEVPDMVIDAHHTIVYLKYSATRALLTRKGVEVTTNSRLGGGSLKKIMTMLGRVRRRQYDDDPSLLDSRPAESIRSREVFNALMTEAERIRMARDDFDITENTIIDSQLYPHHFEQIETAILLHSVQLPTIIKAHFSWNWQCTTLTRGDELTNLPISCLQPYKLSVPMFATVDGRRCGLGRPVFGVLSLYYDTKTVTPGKREPSYNFVLPHKNPLRCPIGSLALLLWYAFDHEGLVEHVHEWDWSSASTWRQVWLHPLNICVIRLIIYCFRSNYFSGERSASRAAGKRCGRCTRHS